MISQIQAGLSLYPHRFRKTLGTLYCSIHVHCEGGSPFFLVNYLCEGLPFSASDYRFPEFAAKALLICWVA